MSSASSNKGHHKRRRNYNHDSKLARLGEHGKETTLSLQDETDVMRMFREYSGQLDDKQDRHERILLLNRAITIESKRIIFLLHQIRTDIDDKRNDTLNEAQARLIKLAENEIKSIALELEHLDPYQYVRAYTNGMQEFTEAALLHNYVRFGQIQTYEEMRQLFRYKVTNELDEERSVCLLYPCMDYVLGLADFTGELMRKCINNLGIGKIDECFKFCNYVKDILTGYLGLNLVGFKGVHKKLHVLRESLNKMEYVCYNIKVRGSEVPEHMLVPMQPKEDKVEEEEVDGFF